MNPQVFLPSPSNVEIYRCAPPHPSSEAECFIRIYGFGFKCQFHQRPSGWGLFCAQGYYLSGSPFPHGLSCFLVSEINILSLGDE